MYPVLPVPIAGWYSVKSPRANTAMFGFLKRKSLGARGEAQAARYLRKQGYRILDRNVKLGRYEIDIIAQEGDMIAFVEVKTRSEDDGIPPETNVGYDKQRRIITAARIYISHRPDAEIHYRFDVVSVILPQKGKASFVLFRDAFQA